MKQQIVALKSVRKTWGFNPVSRVVRSKNTYKRRDKFKRGFEEN